MEDFKLLVIQTGGTVDKDYPKRQGGYAFEICESGAMTILDKVRPSFPYRLVTACREDSQDLTDQHRGRIAQVCRDAEEKFLLITHGTDTILQTAAFLAKHLPCQTTPLSASSQSQTVSDQTDQPEGGRSSSGHQWASSQAESNQSAIPSSQERTGVPTPAKTLDKIICLTGAFLPERFKESDADFNVGVAVGAMQAGLCPGVYVSLGGRVWPWDKVTRASDGQYVSL